MWSRFEAEQANIIIKPLMQADRWAETDRQVRRKPDKQTDRQTGRQMSEKGACRVFIIQKGYLTVCEQKVKKGQKQ